MAASVRERLRRFQNCFTSEDYVLILINADPDAIASAMAVKRLLWRRVVNVTIAHINPIKRPDNLTMIRLLAVSLCPISKVDTQRFNRIVIVDSQPAHHEAFAGFEPDVVIDHHPETGLNAPFVDIRPKYGATASILTEYLRAAKIKPSTKLATGLFYAIKTDTANFTRQAQREDLRAFQFLFRQANIHLTKKIEQAEMRVDFLKYFQKALETRRIRKNRAFIHLGTVINPDVCVLVADFIMRVNTINWSIVSGICGKKIIFILRNDGIRKNAGNVAQTSFGPFGSAGGHKSAARAEIFLDDLKAHLDVGDERKVLNWMINRIERRAKVK
jgi:nanoRNase/pAp phosphatase (c-di-AMP/oligoRNAs hydrolase)